MSLINDALKKAQRERSGEHTPAQPPPVATPPPPPSTTHAAPASSGFKAWPIVAAVAIVVVGFLGWKMFAPSKPADTVAATSESTPAATAPATSTPAPVGAQPEPQPVASAPTTQPAETAPTTTTAAPPPATEIPAEIATTEPAVAAPAVHAQPAPATDLLPVAPKADEQPTVAVNIPSTTAAAPTAAPQELPATVITIPEGPVGTSPAAPLISLRQQDPRILAYLDALRVNGIRPSPDDPKALMNNRVFRIGDVVDRELNLRLTSIAPNKLGFEDDRGMPYLKSF